MTLFVGVYLSTIFFFAGLSFQFGDRLSFYLITALPFILFLLKKNKTLFPRKLSIVWLGFSIFDLVAAMLSSDKQLSIERFLLYQASFLTGIYFFNNKKILEFIVEKVIAVFALVFLAAYLLKDALLKYPSVFDVNNIFNFFFPALPGNNHLGIWLGMAIIIMYFRKKIFLVLGLLPIYLTTFSRSSYLALSVSLSIFFLKDANPNGNVIAL